MALLLRGSSVLSAARPTATATAGAVGLCAFAQRRGFASAADLLAAAPLKSGDVVLQNAGDSADAAAVVVEAAKMGVKTVCIVGATPDFEAVSAKLKDAGALATVTSDYAATWRLARLLSDLPKPTLAINSATGTNAADMVKLVGGGGTLVTYGGKLPKEVAYPGAERKPMKWAEYLSKSGVSAKTV
jgi:NADPH:quinone reductase-like Zn-dependent oxidoreductase